MTFYPVAPSPMSHGLPCVFARPWMQCDIGDNGNNNNVTPQTLGNQCVMLDCDVVTNGSRHELSLVIRICQNWDAQPL